VGGVGIGNAVRAHLQSKIATIATLKCLGASGALVFRTYLFQVLAMAALLLWHRSRPGGALDPDLIAVAPFDILDPAHAIWREGLVTVLSANLDGAGPLHTVSPSVVVRHWSGRADAVSAAALCSATVTSRTVSVPPWSKVRTASAPAPPPRRATTTAPAIRKAGCTRIGAPVQVGRRYSP